MGKTKGGFTLPGESGYEKLTLEMAEKWGADVIRDSDGTELSPEIINAGFVIIFIYRLSALFIHKRTVTVIRAELRPVVVGSEICVLI